MSSQEFDKYIKEQFSNYAPGVHPRIWENIAGRERKKPAGLWFLFYNNKARLLVAALLLSISSGTAWWLLSNHNNPASGNQSNNTVKVTGQESVSSNDPQNNAAQKQDQAADKSDNSNTTGNGSGSGQGAAGIVNNEPSAVTAGDNTSVDQKTGLSSKAAKKLSVYSPSVQADDEETQADNAYPSAKKKQRKSKDLLRLTTTAPGVAEESGEEPLAGGSLLGRLTYDAEMITAKKKAKNLLSLSLRQITFLPDCPAIERNASGNKKYFEFFAGPDYAFRSLSDTGNSEYLRKRKESTKFSTAFSAGFRYTRVFANSMSVRAGINFSQINEKFTFSQGNLVQVTYIIGANGDTLGSYTTVGTRYKTTINRYRTLDIPLSMGYEVGNGKWHANINAGVIVNIYSWQKGDVLDTAYNPVNITTGKGSSPYQFKTNAGVGFIGAVSVYYKLTDRLHLMAEPYFRYNFSPMNKDNITLKQKYQTAGLRLGVRLDLR